MDMCGLWFIIFYHGYSWFISCIMDIHGLSLFIMIMVYAVYDVSYF